MLFKIAVNDPSNAQFSLDKKNADFSHNQIVLNSIVGTLVKYGLSGKIEPYLAESWIVSADKKKWQFKIRSNLFCDDGTLITANLYKSILLANLKEYSTSGSVIIFDHLNGWEEFKAGTSAELSGLLAHDNIVEMSFDENPDDLLELLRMPYFGLWKEENNKLTSSGPYTVKSIEKNKIFLELRKDWFTSTKNSFQEVEIGFSDIDNQQIGPSTIIRLPFFIEPIQSEDAYWITSPPTRLESLVLSPYKNNFFNIDENREIFRNRINQALSDLGDSKFFYPSAKTKGLDYKKIEFKNNSQKETLTFALERSTYTTTELENLKKTIGFALKGSRQEFQIISKSADDQDWFKKTDSNTYFDARVSSVDIGAYPIYTAIKMMFCTKLGINFPDKTGEICKLVTNGIISANPINQNFIDSFNQIIHKDAVVIPIHHHSDKWLVSNNLDPSTLPATTLYPQFELIRLK